MKLSRYVAAASLAFAAVGTATVAHAGGNVQFSVAAAVPGVALGVSNAPVYYPRPVYAQPYYAPPAPVYYVPPAPVVYVPPAPVYYGTYYGAAPVYYNRPHWNHHRHHGHHRHQRH